MCTIDHIGNASKVAVVVVGYNRLESIKRLLLSLEQACYPSNDIPLVVSIDASGDELLYEFVRGYKWQHGDCYAIIHEKRLGLKEHIFSCGDMTKYFKGVIVLEDDLYVSPYFYDYVCKTLEYYENNPLVASIGLYSYQSNIYAALPFQPYQGLYDVWATQATVTWGECWNKRMWSDFRKWLDDNTNIDWASLDIATNIKKFKRAWSKFFSAYLWANKLFVVVPYKSYTTNFSESGEHNHTQVPVAQVPIVNRKEELLYAPVEQLVRYDSFFDPLDIFDLLPVPKEDVYIDLYGNRPNTLRKRFLISVDILPYECVRTYALSMRPIDCNIRYQLDGDGIYLYDLNHPIKRKTDKQPVQSISYRLIIFRPSLLSKYLRSYIVYKIKMKIHG